MKCLLIETSTERGFVAIFEGKTLVLHTELPIGFQNSTFLLPEVDRAFKVLEMKPSELDYIGVGTGPGSYTGIRVGAITAKTLAFALNKPLVGICSLEGFIPTDDGVFAAVIDAKIGGVYVHLGEKRGDQIEWLSKPEVFPLAEAAEVMRVARMIVTPNATMIKNKLIGYDWIWEERSPDVQYMARRVAEAMQQGVSGELELLYLRKTQAEINRGK